MLWARISLEVAIFEAAVGSNESFPPKGIEISVLMFIQIMILGMNVSELTHDPLTVLMTFKNRHIKCNHPCIV